MKAVLGAEKPLIGMVHLLPLPGSYSHRGKGLRAVLERAFSDLAVLEEGGADAALVENFGDVPFPKRASKSTVAFMTAVVGELVRRAGITIGVNVLRSDGEAALAVAAAAGARFIRVNVFTGVAFTDQGIIEGEAHRLLALRKALGAGVAIFADVNVKHAWHLQPLELAARDAARNLPDALIVTGSGTGQAACPEDLAQLKAAAGLPVLVGSGITPGNVAEYRAADGFIVGTSIKRDGDVHAPVDPARVAALAARIAMLRAGGTGQGV